MQVPISRKVLTEWMSQPTNKNSSFPYLKDQIQLHLSLQVGLKSFSCKAYRIYMDFIFKSFLLSIFRDIKWKSSGFTKWNFSAPRASSRLYGWGNSSCCPFPRPRSFSWPSPGNYLLLVCSAYNSKKIIKIRLYKVSFPMRRIVDDVNQGTTRKPLLKFNFTDVGQHTVMVTIVSILLLKVDPQFF